jgi:Na+/proline symporter
MTDINIWTILGIITIVLLILFWRKRNAVWGGLTIGIIIGIIVALFYLFKGNGFNWFVIGKGAIAGTMLGFVAELLGKISDLIKKKE